MVRLQTRLIGSLLLILIPLVLQSCFTFTTLSTGRSLGKGAHEITPSVSSYYVKGAVTTPVLPQLSYTYGLTEKFDLGAQVSLAIVGMHAKYQIVGDQDSRFCMAPGIQYNYFGVSESSSGTAGSGDPLRLSLSNLSVPLHMSWHPTPALAIALSPRYVRLGGQGAVGGNGDKTAIQMLGLTPALEIGRKFRFVVEANLLSPLNTNDNFTGFFSTFAFGAKFRLGGK